MADTCEDCGAVLGFGQTHCGQVTCLIATKGRLRALLDRYRALAKAADGMYAIGLRATDEWHNYAKARAAVREIEDASPKRPDDSDT